MSDASTIGASGRRGRAGRVVLLAVILGVLGAVAGAAVGFRLAAVHTATASVLVNPLSGNPYSPTGSGTALVNLETEAQLVRSTDVVSAVQQKTGVADAAALGSGLSVTVPSNTQILTIAYASGRADESVKVAQAFAESYLDFRLRRATALVQTQVDQINEQVPALQKQQSRLGDRLDDVDQDSGEASVLRAQLESTTSQLDQLKANLADLQSTPLNAGQVITPATLPAPGPVPVWVLTALGGLLGGVILGVLLGSLALGRRPLPQGVGAPPAAAPAA